jgi:hypothetical protein
MFPHHISDPLQLTVNPGVNPIALTSFWPPRKNSVNLLDYHAITHETQYIPPLEKRRCMPAVRTEPHSHVSDQLCNADLV